MIPAQLLAVQLELECIGVDAQGLLVRIPGPHPDGIPRFYVGEYAGGSVRYCARDVPAGIRERLLALPLARARDDRAAVCRILAEDAPCEDVWDGVNYTFHPDFRAPDDPGVLRLDASERDLIERFDTELLDFPPPVYAVVVDGAIVSACVSSRENALAGEAWVQTHPGHRRRGYARRVTAAWGAGLLHQGKIAFYSHHTDNSASAAVARDLGLTRYLADVGYS